MKVLFDENVPWPLRKHLAAYEVQVTAELGWASLANGELLRQAEAAGFDVLLTADRELRYQQNLAARRIAVVELTQNHWPSVEPQIEEIAAALRRSVPGSYEVVTCVYRYRGRRRMRKSPE